MTEAGRPLPALRRRAALATLGALAGGVLLTPATCLAALRRETDFLFGSPVELLVSAGSPASSVEAVRRDLRTMNSQWNAWKPGELGSLNAALRAGRPARPSPALAALIRAAAVLERRSGGLFNAGIGGLVDAWGFHADRLEAGRRPDEAAIARWRASRPSLAQLEWRGADLTSHNPALRLDLGAIGKGFAIDRALDRLAAAGVRDALVNLGGNLAGMGDAGGRPWRIGVRDPDGPGIVATLQTEGREAVVTSGVYERFRVLDGERVHHILEPGEGRPSEGFVSVTVVHRSATVADAAATALLVAGPGRWRAVAERMGVPGVLAIDAAGRPHLTPWIEARVQLEGSLRRFRRG